METIDDESTDRCLEFLERAHRDGKPFFVWCNTTHMHLRTHPKQRVRGKSGQGFYNDVMVEHDEYIGKILSKLDELGIAEDTIVLYSTDNGPHFNTWPDASITCFRSEKNTNWSPRTASTVTDGATSAFPPPRASRRGLASASKTPTT